MSERWCAIKDFEGAYSISERWRALGEKRTLLRRNGYRFTLRERILAQRTYPSGLRLVILAALRYAFAR